LLGARREVSLLSSFAPVVIARFSDSAVGELIEARAQLI